MKTSKKAEMPEPTNPVTALFISKLLKQYLFRFNNEKQLQVGIENVLLLDEIPYSREHHLGDAGIVDFLVDGRVAVEVKVEGSVVAVVRQLMRYADRPEVEAIVLVTTKARLGRGFGDTLRGKPAHVVEMWTGFL